MILTDKALSDFNQFLYINYPDNIISENCGYGYGMFERDLEQLTYVLPEFMNNALIIEWLDSVYFYVTIDREENMFIYTIDYPNDIYFSNWDDLYFETRSEATKQAIIKANEIYNNLNTNENEK